MPRIYQHKWGTHAERQFRRKMVLDFLSRGYSENEVASLFGMSYDWIRAIRHKNFGPKRAKVN